MSMDACINRRAPEIQRRCAARIPQTSRNINEALPEYRLRYHGAFIQVVHIERTNTWLSQAALVMCTAGARSAAIGRHRDIHTGSLAPTSALTRASGATAHAQQDTSHAPKSLGAGPQGKKDIPALYMHRAGPSPISIELTPGMDPSSPIARAGHPRVHLCAPNGIPAHLHNTYLTQEVR